MPKKYTITGFEKHCRKRNYKSYRYTTESQKRSEDNLKMILSFNILDTCLSPNRIYIIGQHGLICFQKVKYIIQVSQSNDYDEFEIVCDDISHDSTVDKEIVYTMTAKI